MSSCAQDSKGHPGCILGPHRGAIDQTTTTTQPPPEVMKRVRQVLEGMGIEIQVESEYKYRCIRAKQQSPVEDDFADSPADDTTPKTIPRTLTTADSATSSTSDLAETVNLPLPTTGVEIVYGARSEDPGDEVRFSVELTKLDGLMDTYCLDIRRLKGNLKSYKFLYDLLRERANLQR